MMIQNTSQYKILSYSGCGSQHIVYKAQLSLNQKFYAIKLEKSPLIGQLKNEIEMLQKLSGVDGVPELIQYGLTPEQKQFIIMPLFHSSLLELAKSRKLSFTLILTIGLRIIEILEKVHQKNILHLDIKPENIMLSYQPADDQDFSKPGLIQLIDFGLSQQFDENSESLRDVFVGSLNFASRSSHEGTSIGYKDDLESLLYVLIYIQDLRLPWSNQRFWGFKEVDLELIGETKKTFFKASLLQQQSLLNFQPFISYIEQLKHNTIPNYDYIKKLFLQMISRSCTQQFNFNEDKQKALNVQIQAEKLLGVAETIKFSLEKIQVQNTYDEIQEEDNWDNSSVLVSRIIGQYTTNQIKSIKDLEI